MGSLFSFYLKSVARWLLYQRCWSNKNRTITFNQWLEEHGLIIYCFKKKHFLKTASFLNPPNASAILMGTPQLPRL